MMKYKPIVVPSAATGEPIEVVNYNDLLKADADVYIIFGLRSYGKSYGILKYVIDNWIDKGQEFVTMRTVDDDVLQGKARKYIATIKPYFEDRLQWEKELTVYNSDIVARWVNADQKKIERDPVGHMMSLSGWLKYKGNNYDNVTTVIFEEFLERKPKLTNEAFMEGYLNNLSTVIRRRGKRVKVFLLANTVRKKSPIFDYYGIRINKLTKGQPVQFRADNGLKICAFWTPDPKLDNDVTAHYTVSQTKESKMITSGDWEENSYKTAAAGKVFHQILTSRVYARAPILRLTDVMVDLRFPDFEYRKPVMFMKSGKAKHVTRSTLSELFYCMPAIAMYTRKMILSNNVITDGKVNDIIDQIRDAVF